MGLCGLGPSGGALPGPVPLGPAHRPELQGALRPTAGPGSDCPHFLAGVYQFVHGDRAPARGGNTPAAVQLWRLVADHYHAGLGTPVEPAHAPLSPWGMK